MTAGSIPVNLRRKREFLDRTGNSALVRFHLDREIHKGQ
jgi:hypothetical protein